MTKYIFLLFIPIMILESCITSLQPLVTKNTAVTDSRLTGTWNSDGHDYTIQKVFESDFYKKHKKDLVGLFNFNQDSVLYSKSYVIQYVKNKFENKLEYVLFGSVIKLNGEYFMNFTVAGLNRVDSTVSIGIDPANRLQSYTIARIRFGNSNTIKLEFINGDFLYNQINAGRMKIKHETDELFGTFLITASTSELQQFIQKYGNDDRFFDKENSVTLIRKS